MYQCKLSIKRRLSKSFCNEVLKKTLFTLSPSVVLFLSITGCLISKVVYQQRLSSIQRLSVTKGCLSSKMPSLKRHFLSQAIFHRRLSSIKICLHSEVIILHTLSSMKGLLSLKVFFHKGHLPSKVVFHQRASSIIPWFILYL